MGVNRLFWPQQTMDEWIVEEKVSIEGGVLKIRDARRSYQMSQAVYFEADVGGGGDPHGLIGRVKDTEALAALGAEHYMDSVLLGDSAYKVTPGFTGVPLPAPGAKLGGDITGAVITQSGGKTEAENDDRELLARFLLDNL